MLCHREIFSEIFSLCRIILVAYEHPFAIFVKQKTVKRIQPDFICDPLFLEQSIVIILDGKTLIFFGHAEKGVRIFLCMSYQSRKRCGIRKESAVFPINEYCFFLAADDVEGE